MLQWGLTRTHARADAGGWIAQMFANEVPFDGFDPLDIRQKIFDGGRPEIPVRRVRARARTVRMSLCVMRVRARG